MRLDLALRFPLPAVAVETAERRVIVRSTVAEVAATTVVRRVFRCQSAIREAATTTEWESRVPYEVAGVGVGWSGPGLWNLCLEACCLIGHLILAGLYSFVGWYSYSGFSVVRDEWYAD